MKKLLIFFAIVAFFVAAGCNPVENDMPEENNIGEDTTKETTEKSDEETTEKNSKKTTDVTLYFGCSEAIKSGEPGEYGLVAPVSREISYVEENSEEILHASLEELIKGPSPEDGDVLQVVHSSVDILDITIEDKTAIINLSEEMFSEDWTGGTTGGSVFIQAFTNTAAEFSTVDEVQVLVEGDYWNDGHWIWDEPKKPSKDLSAEIEKWIENSRKLWLAQDVIFGDTRYLLVTYGEKPTGGYSVEISDVNEKNDKLTVTVEFTEPGESESVTQAITYPYDLKKIEPTSLPVEFVAEGDENYVPRLRGINAVRPIKAQSYGIKVFSPTPHSAVPREFNIEGIANVFEGTVLYRLSDETGKKLISGITTGSMGDWGYFEERITVPDDLKSGEDFLLELYTESAKDRSIQDLIEIDLELAQE